MLVSVQQNWSFVLRENRLRSWGYHRSVEVMGICQVSGGHGNITVQLRSLGHHRSVEVMWKSQVS